MQHLEKGVRISERNSSADSNIRAEGGTGDALSAGAEIPLWPVVKSLANSCAPAAHRGSHQSRPGTCNPHWTMWKFPEGS